MRGVQIDVASLGAGVHVQHVEDLLEWTIGGHVRRVAVALAVEISCAQTQTRTMSPFQAHFGTGPDQTAPNIYLENGQYSAGIDGAKQRSSCVCREVKYRFATAEGLAPTRPAPPEPPVVVASATCFCQFFCCRCAAVATLCCAREPGACDATCC